MKQSDAFVDLNEKSLEKSSSQQKNLYLFRYMAGP